MKICYLSLKKKVNNTYLSLDHINTGTGKEDSAYENTKTEIKPLNNKKEDEAAILLHTQGT